MQRALIKIIERLNSLCPGKISTQVLGSYVYNIIVNIIVYDNCEIVRRYFPMGCLYSKVGAYNFINKAHVP